MSESRRPDPSMMPFRRGHRPDDPGTGPPAAFAVAHEAYRSLPAEDRDDMFAGALVRVLLGEVSDPVCSWFDDGKPCGQSATWLDQERALCPRHTKKLLEERQRRREREAKRIRDARRMQRLRDSQREG
jgi:hypothetical protein